MAKRAKQPRHMRAETNEQRVSLLPIPSFTVFAATIAINLLALAIPLFSIQVYDRIIAQQGYATLYVLGAGVAIALLLELTLRLLRGWLISRAAARTEARLSALAFRSLARADLGALRQHTTSSLLQGFQAISRLREFHGGQAFITLLELPFGALYLVAIAYLGGPLVFVPLALLTLFAWRALGLSSALQKALLAREQADRKRYDFLAETLAGIHTIKACSAEQRQLRRYDHLQQELNGSNYSTVAIANKAAGDGALYGQIMLRMMTLCGAWIAGGGWQGHGLTLGGLIACILLAGRVMQPVQRALGLWHRFQDGQLAERSLQRLQALEPRAGAQPRATVAPNSAAAVTLSNVSFAYPSQAMLQANLLNNISLDLTPGEAISFDGPPGCGKSTLLRIISGLYAPTQGIVRLDGQPLWATGMEESALAELPASIAYLRADAGILRGTVADNLTRFGLIKLADMLPLARLLDLEQDIAQLPLGYATPLLGTQADAVPPGFKQRLALARALAPVNGARPRLVLYDAADRGLDTRGYSALLTLLGRMLGRTTLVLATSDANIRALAQRHYRLSNGTLQMISNDSGIATARQASLQPDLSGVIL